MIVMSDIVLHIVLWCFFKSKDVVYSVAEAIATEARAINNDATAHTQYGLMTGISCFAPFVNIARHPLWGRVQVRL